MQTFCAANHSERKKITKPSKALVVSAKTTFNEAKEMKRLNNIFEKIISIENLQEADQKAQQGKAKQYGVILHNRNREANLLKLQEMLKNKTYRTSQYHTFKVFEPKEREVFRLPFFPDRICHHAIMNILESIFVSVFTADSYSCIKGRGIHKASYNLRKSLKDKFPFRTKITKDNDRLEFT